MVTKSDVFVLVLIWVLPNSGEVSNEKRLLHSYKKQQIHIKSSFAKQYLKKGIVSS